jgi:outer membrane protein assembly factor BamB
MMALWKTTFARGPKMAAAALCLTALAGCSIFSNDDGRNDPAPLTEYAPGLAVKQVWKTSVGRGAGIGFAPVVINDAVYAATPNGKLGKYNLADGRSVWTADADTDLSAGVGTDGNVTVVASERGEIIAYDDSGKEKWRTRATSNVSVPPVVGFGVVVIRSGDYRIQAFDINSGERMWSLQRPGPALALQSGSQMVLAQGLVITGLPGGKLLAINTASGNVQWEATVSQPKGGSDLERLTDVVGAPQIAGRLLCAVAYQGRITCFDVSQGGRALWAKDFSSSSGMTVDDRNAYTADAQSVANAFSLDAGSNLWKQNALRNRQLSAPAVLRGAVAYGDYDGYVHFLSSTDGKLLARVSLGGGAIVSPLQTTSQGVLVQTGNGDIALIGTP